MSGRFAHFESAVTRKRQRAFDDDHPFPPCAVKVRRQREQLQRAGLLPEGEEQLVPADLQAYIDDHGGSGLTDITGIPPSLQHIVLDLSMMSCDGGVPAPVDSRVMNYARMPMDSRRDAGELRICPLA